ncbi:MAG TPA: pentapeptide repeat-containing protein [Herpetosiphonaceae bacterium]
MANEEHLAILRQGVDVWNQWREEHVDIVPNLSRADLSELDLRGVDFTRGILYWVILRAANLTGANLLQADLIEADL